MTGYRMGTTISSMAYGSMTQPSMRNRKRIHTRISVGERGKPATNSARTTVSLLAARKCPKIIAPIRIRKTMPVVTAILINEVFIFFQLSRLLPKPMSKAQRAPTAAASVGVNTPE